MGLKSKYWPTREDSIELREIILNAIDNTYPFDKEEDSDFMTSIRINTMYVELYRKNKFVHGTSRKLPDYDFDDVRIERELLQEFISNYILDNTVLKDMSKEEVRTRSLKLLREHKGSDYVQLLEKIKRDIEPLKNKEDGI